MATTYILYSSTLNKYYIGSTRDSMEDRFRRHLSHHDGFTAKASDWIIVYNEYFEDYQMAIAKELLIKSWKSRKMIERLIQKQ